MHPRNLLAATCVTALLSLASAAPALAADGSTPSAPSPSTSTSTIAPDPTAPQIPDSRKRLTLGLQTASASGPDQRVRYDYEIAPRGVRQDYVAVYNYSGRAAEVALAARDATSTPDDAYTVQPDDARPVDVGSWIALAQTSLRLRPRSVALVPFQVGVPYDATPGDHAGAIVLTVRTAGRRAGQSVVVSNRVGLRMAVRVPGALRPQLRVEDLHTTADGALRWWGLGRLSTTYTVRNVGNVAVSGRQMVSYLRSFGLDPLKAPAGRLPTLLPGGHSQLSTGGDRAFTIGDLTTRVSVTPEGDRLGSTPVPEASAETTLRLIPWALIAVALLVLSGAGIVGRLLARRLRRPPSDADGSGGHGTDPDDPADPAEPAEPVEATFVAARDPEPVP